MHVQWLAKYIIYSWNLPFFLWFFFLNYGWTFGESNNNKSFQIWWISETKWLVSTLRIWSLILSPQIRQSEAKARINAKKSNETDLPCLRETREWNTCFGPRNSKIVYQNSRLSIISTFNITQVNRYENRGKISKTS